MWQKKMTILNLSSHVPWRGNSSLGLVGSQIPTATKVQEWFCQHRVQLLYVKI